MKIPAEGAYFNSGVMLMNLDELRKQHFFERAVEFLNRKSDYRFWDQSAINFLLHGQIHELPEYWNRASWRFDAQQNNDLDCVLHYTASAPWLGGTRGPAQVLFERFAADAGLPVNRGSPRFQKIGAPKILAKCIRPIAGACFSNRVVVLPADWENGEIGCLSESRRVTGSITFAIRRVDGGFIASAARKLVE